MESFEKALIFYPWDEQFMNKSVDEKVFTFHTFLKTNLDKYLPEKVTQMSNIDRKWMSPQLKQLHRAMQREFYNQRRSKKYIKMRAKFRKLKRKSVKSYFASFVIDLKLTDPAKL